MTSQGSRSSCGVDESDSGCCSVSDVEDARRVAQQLGIDHHVFNFGDDFDRHVIEPYVEAYDEGRTPNPCIECNRHIKFDKLLRRADALGFDLVATGHHARISQAQDGSLFIARGADPAKDQSYVLHMLGQQQLRRLLLPVGDMTKDHVRQLAHDLGLRTADKPDSQDVCFIHSDGGRRAFLGDRIPLSPAKIVDGAGTELGHTDAVQLVTIGQRKGLGLAGNDTRHYVVGIDRPNGVVTVGTEDETMCERTELLDVAWTADGHPTANDLGSDDPVLGSWLPLAWSSRRFSRCLVGTSPTGRVGPSRCLLCRRRGRRRRYCGLRGASP